MYCTYCGKKLVNDVCPKCNKAKTKAQHQNDIVYEDEKSKREPNSAKIFSIVCIATAILGLLGYGYPYCSIAAIVFGALYKSKMGQDSTLTKAGKILGIVGLIVTTIVLLVSTIVSFILALLGTIYSFVWALAVCFGYVEELYEIIASYVSYFI